MSATTPAGAAYTETMVETVVPWARRLMVMAAAVAVVAWILKSASRSDQARVPVITGDTWPPVPVNPLRQG